MLDNVITLAVDEDNSGSGTINHVYTRFDSVGNKSTYISGSHALDARDTLTFYRTFPKTSGNFKGVAKTALKFSQDIGVAGVDSETTLTAPIILEVSVSLPVGATAAQAMVARQRVIALLDTDALMVAHMEQQQI